jgi:long-chain fatty acid transport protein
MTPTPKVSHRSICTILMALILAGIHSTSFALPHRSAAGIALTNSLVANTQDIYALAYNPSVAVFHENPSVSKTLMLLKPSMGVTPEGGVYKEGQSKDTVLVPGLSGHLTLFNDIALILNVNAPFSSGSEWELGTFPNAATYNPMPAMPNGDATGSAQPTQSKLEIVTVSPSIAFKLGKQSSIALGADYYKAQEVLFNAQAKENKGDGDGWGLNLSLSSQITDKIGIGLTYHSPTTIDITGTTISSFTGISDAKSELTLPWRIQAGIHAAITNDLSVEFDITRTGWNNYDSFQIESGSPSTSDYYWEDANTYSLGVQYALNDIIQLRFGYSYGENRQPDAYFNARMPDNDRYLLGIGAGYELVNGWNLDIGYTYVKFKDRTFNSTTTPLAPETDLNGTNAYNGNYEGDTHLFGLTVTKQF